MNITKNERRLIKALAESEYVYVDDPNDPIQYCHMIWTHCVDGFSTETKFPGTMSSLVKKGLGVKGKDQDGYRYVALTERGAQLYINEIKRKTFVKLVSRP